MDSPLEDTWSDGTAYERYVGRWSRLVAREFLRWLEIPPDKRWLDVGCGTGALSQTILELASPEEVRGVDPSRGYAAHAGKAIADARARFLTGDARALPFGAARFDVVVSGLVLNFVPEPGEAVAEMTRVTRLGGTVAAYVWDYAGRMQLMRHFWEAAAALDPEASELDEGRRFPLCRPEPLSELFRAAGLRNVEVRAIDVPTHFEDFEDYWSPFLGGQGPAPGYAASLSEALRGTLRERLRASLPTAADGSIRLIARAWAVRGKPKDLGVEQAAHATSEGGGSR
ncbi:MAG: methyltransferase domain-containing protein [Actinobacteria bacterium]|nr:methyltransferase domain-containing protein [Actinomycetota bacterium]